jgi:predicted MFS family arabinose efflux permease
MAGLGGGLAGGAAVAALLLRRWSERATMRLGTLVTAGALALCVRQTLAVWDVLAFAAVGAGMQMVLVAGWLRVHHHIRPSAACAVFAVIESHQLLGNAAGALVAGIAIERSGPWPTVVTCVVVLCGASAMLGRPAGARPADASAATTAA